MRLDGIKLLRRADIVTSAGSPECRLFNFKCVQDINIVILKDCWNNNKGRKGNKNSNNNNNVDDFDDNISFNFMSQKELIENMRKLLEQNEASRKMVEERDAQINIFITKVQSLEEILNTHECIELIPRLIAPWYDQAFCLLQKLTMLWVFSVNWSFANSLD